MSVIRFAKGDSITARRLNQIIDVANRLDADRLPRQEAKGGEGPLITDDTKTEAVSATIETWDEVYRETEVVRVTNPDDSEQYVDVDRVIGIAFRKPDGVLVLLRLSNE